MIATPDSIEGTVIVVMRWVKLGVEIFGAGLVTLGVCVAIVHLIRTLAARKSAEFTTTQLIVARYLALALEFELIWRWKATELAKREEREVSQNLPQEYAAYKARVQAFIPRFRPKTDPKEAR